MRGGGGCQTWEEGRKTRKEGSYRCTPLGLGSQRPKGARALFGVQVQRGCESPVALTCALNSANSCACSARVSTRAFPHSSCSPCFPAAVGTEAETDDEGGGRAALCVASPGSLGVRQSSAVPVESAYPPHWHSGSKASTSRTCSSKSVSRHVVPVKGQGSTSRNYV